MIYAAIKKSTTLQKYDFEHTLLLDWFKIQSTETI